MKKPELSEDQKTKNLAGNAFYKSKKTPKSQMIMLKLLQANRQNSLQKANKIAALAFFIKPDSEGLAIDYDLVDVIYSVSNSLLKTTKQKGWVDYWNSYIYYIIPWSFQFSIETYMKYISPWMQICNYHDVLVPKIEKRIIKETWAFCPYCNKPFLNMVQTTKEEALKTVQKFFSDSIREKVRMVILEEEYERRKELTLPREYIPPHWRANLLKCPTCEKEIGLTYRFYPGTDPHNYEKPVVSKLRYMEIIFENRESLDPFIELLRYKAASGLLTEKGYHQQINSFLQWAEPHVNNIEYEILKLVDENVLEKYLDQLFESNQDQPPGVEQD